MSDDRRYLIPFRATLLPQIFTDTLVIGSGVAGLRAAIAAHEHGDVIVTGKGGIKDSNTYWAQGGVSVVLDESDSIDSHVQDTVTAGAGLCDEPIVRLVASGARARIDELVEWGMKLDQVGGRPALGMEGGHSHPRIVHSDGDATGRELAMTLDRQVRSLDRVRLFENCFVLDLITLDGSPPQCLGAITHHPKYGLQVIWARATILATGGCGQVYRESTNPNAATGDGLAMAYRAGAELADLEFVQFHPTTLYVAGASRSLISEAVRGEGAYLVDRNGHRFMQDYDERGELAPRDVVSRSILKQMAATNHTNVYLDVRHLGGDNFAKRFPGINRLLTKFDIDPATQTIPIHPSAHYMVGGVRTDEHARTSIQGLYAAGEIASTGLHGANRLASNSLLEGLVFGEIAGRTCAEVINGESTHSPVKVISDIRPSDRSELDLADVRSSLRSVMWRHVGIERQGERLGEVAEMFDFWARYTLDKIFDDCAGWEVQNLLTVGSLITRAARTRLESRGCHYRLDHPDTDDSMRVHQTWTRGEHKPGTTAVADSSSSIIAG